MLISPIDRDALRTQVRQSKPVPNFKIDNFLDEEFAKPTMFKGRIAHGMLTAGFVSAVFGTKLPGPGCVYISQNLRFKAPVKIGDTVKARVTVSAIDQDKARVSFATTCHVGDKIVLDGEAQLMVPRRPAA